MAGCAAITGASPDVMLKQWRAGWTALPGCRSTAGSAGTAAQRGRPPGLPDLPGPSEALGRLPGIGRGGAGVPAIGFIGRAVRGASTAVLDGVKGPEGAQRGLAGGGQGAPVSAVGG